ncbi:hypothetical protein BDZ89DRAFT_1046665 [Hymenopellis radicata]|nr:hypothetical protein BDZ89DRAFT_1046665 [Hymenopellis radicata]
MGFDEPRGRPTRRTAVERGEDDRKWPEAPSPMRLNLQNLKLVAIQPQVSPTSHTLTSRYIWSAVSDVASNIEVTHNDDSLWQVNASERRSPRAIRTMMSKISGGKIKKAGGRYELHVPISANHTNRTNLHTCTSENSDIMTVKSQTKKKIRHTDHASAPFVACPDYKRKCHQL